MSTYRVTKATMALETFDVEADSEAQAIAQVSGVPGTLVTQSAAWSAVLTSTEPVPEPVNCPSGFGVYLRRISGAASDATIVASRCAKSGILWAHFMVESSDGYVTSPSTRSVWAKAFRDLGIQIGVWSFPGDSRAASVQESVSSAKLLCEAAAEIEASAVMLNIEKPYKGKPVEMRALCDTVYADTSERSYCGVISYPVPSYHPDLNWDAMSGFDFGSPMFYTTAEDPVLVNRGLKEWGDVVPFTVPSLDGWNGTGVEGAARFRDDIVRVCGAPPTSNLPGAIVWSESQMDDAKRAVTRDMAEKYGWPRP